MRRSLPIIRGLVGSGHRPAGLKDLDKIKRTLPARPVDSSLECFLQDEDGFGVLDELTNLGIFDDLGICRPPDSGRIAPESTQTPFPLTSHSPGATRRGQRQFHIENPQTTFEDCEQIIEGAIPVPPLPPPPPLPTGFTPTYTECRDRVNFSWENVDGFSGLRVEISDSEAGPWTRYITRSDVPTSLQLSNYFNGARFVRFSVLYGTGYLPFLIAKPEPAVVAPPTFVTLTNVDNQLFPDVVASPLDGDSVYVVSEFENSLIGLPGEGYVEVRRRFSWVKDPYNPPPLPAIALFSHSNPFAIIKFSVDNTTPTLLTGQLNGTDSNPNADSFGHILRAVAIVDGCTSPECLIAVDKHVNSFGQTLIWAKGSSLQSSCDLPKDDQETTANCNQYGGPQEFRELVKFFACLGETIGNIGGGLAFWLDESEGHVGPPVNGFFPFIVTADEYRFHHVDWNRPVDLDSYPPDLYCLVVAGVSETLQTTTHEVIGPQNAGTSVTGPSGTMAGAITALSALLTSRTRPCPFIGGSGSLESLVRITTRVRD